MCVCVCLKDYNIHTPSEVVIPRNCSRYTNGLFLYVPEVVVFIPFYQMA